MGGQRDQIGELRVDRPAAVAPDPDVRAEQGLGGGGAEANQRFRLDHLELGLEPRKAGVDLPAVGRLVDPSLTPELVAEMLDHVGDVDVVAGYPRSLESLVEDATRWPDERMAFDVLAVAGLLADQHQARVRGALAHNRLRGALPQIAGAALLHLPVQAGQRGPLRNRGGRVVETHPPGPLPRR